jgi:hypothetical protein
MDESPNPGENEESEARLGRISPSGCNKRRLGAESGGRVEMLLHPLRLSRYSLTAKFIMNAEETATTETPNHATAPCNEKGRKIPALITDDQANEIYSRKPTTN